MGVLKAQVDGVWTEIPGTGPQGPQGLTGPQGPGGQTWKLPVRCATPANTNFNFLSGLIVVDGIQTAEGDRVLLKAQTQPANNGIYIASAGSWVRPTDADQGSELVGAVVVVMQGTVGAGTMWMCSTPSPISIGTTALTFIKIG